jgi:hypothetical protein
LLSNRKTKNPIVGKEEEFVLLLKSMERALAHGGSRKEKKGVEEGGAGASKKKPTPEEYHANLPKKGGGLVGIASTVHRNAKALSGCSVCVLGVAVGQALFAAGFVCRVLSLPSP